jgi:NAD(P)-dependent dehydrogenase (short-subunit alcohol dehydrogenase family)
MNPEVVVVTGASAGLGRAIVREFARRGASIGLVARDPSRLEETKVEVERLGGRAVAIPTDVADADAVEAAAARIEESFGPIDVWVNNAMTSVFSPVKEMAADEFRRVTEVAYLGYVYGTQAALRRMLPRDQGVIVQVGSALSYRSIPLQSAYCAAKHAIVGFTDSLRSELIHDNSHVRVTIVHMPALNTPQFTWVKSRLLHKAQPVPPIFQPEVGAEAVYWAAHHDRRELFVGWPTVKAVWGQKLVPGFADRYLARNGYQGQQYDGLEDPDRPHNLWEPVPGRFGAHGDFDDRAAAVSLEAWADTHRSWLGAAGVAVAAIALAFKARR